LEKIFEIFWREKNSFSVFSDTVFLKIVRHFISSKPIFEGFSTFLFLIFQVKILFLLSFCSKFNSLFNSLFKYTKKYF